MHEVRSDWHKESFTIIHVPSGLKFTYDIDFNFLPCSSSVEKFKYFRAERGAKSEEIDTDISILTSQAKNIVWREALALNP